jgi:hypothetical protein
MNLWAKILKKLPPAASEIRVLNQRTGKRLRKKIRVG